MNYTIKAIETRYKGHLFRSQLEATWAAFFDLCGWQWEYEPFTLNGWLPDFALIGKGKTILVEVKPVFSFPREVAEKIDMAVKDSGDNTNNITAIFGNGLHFYNKDMGEFLQVGFFFEPWDGCWEGLDLGHIHANVNPNGDCSPNVYMTEKVGLGCFGKGAENDILSGEPVVARYWKYAFPFDEERGRSLWGRAKEATRYVHGRRSA